MAPAVRVQSQALCSPAPGANSVSLSTRQSRRETSLWLLMGSTLECSPAYMCLMALRFISRFIFRHPCCLVQLRCPVCLSCISQSCLSRAFLSSHAGAGSSITSSSIHWVRVCEPLSHPTNASALISTLTFTSFSNILLFY